MKYPAQGGVTTNLRSGIIVTVLAYFSFIIPADICTRHSAEKGKGENGKKGFRRWEGEREKIGERRSRKGKTSTCEKYVVRNIN